MNALVVTMRSAPWRTICCRGFGMIRSLVVSGHIVPRTASSARSNSSLTSSAPVRADQCTTAAGICRSLTEACASASDWNVFLGHAAATLAKFKVPEAEQSEVVKFVQGLKKEIVEERASFRSQELNQGRGNM